MRHINEPRKISANASLSNRITNDQRAIDVFTSMKRYAQRVHVTLERAVAWTSIAPGFLVPARAAPIAP
ncbi:hypothetical protein DS909_04145 [Phaeobacter gallaeciensis]|uniref:Uncharacterized protein n=1 Tax=Phaeobacter gallaeciensis TaxID=60890 RepID=A0A366X9K7_9RHOB|nr:hypothetical protein DS909_04145 [Phaeobacter gallaeciensis]